MSVEVWAYEVSGKRVLTEWFSYRKQNRDRPIMGDRRPPSQLGEIQPDCWLAEYTTELLNVLHVLGALADLEPSQSKLLARICAGPMIAAAELASAEGPAGSAKAQQTARNAHRSLFDLLDAESA